MISNYQNNRVPQNSPESSITFVENLVPAEYELDVDNETQVQVNTPFQGDNPVLLNPVLLMNELQQLQAEQAEGIQDVQALRA